MDVNSWTTELRGLLGAPPADADIGVGGAGPTKAEDVRQAGPALTAVVTDPGDVALFMWCPRDAKRRPTNCSSWKWLNALIADMAVRAMLFSDCAIEIDGDDLRATAYGEAVEIAGHEPAVEI
jgi:SHS2 domain-containing protein